MIERGIKPVKIVIHISMMLALLFCLASCKNKKQLKAEKEIKRDPTEVAEDKNEKTFHMVADEKDAQFLVNVAGINLMEIKMAELAMTRFRIHEVKDLASMLLADHTKILDEMKTLALRKEIVIPSTLSEERESSCKILKEKASGIFDKEYCDHVISDHEEAIVEFERASKECADVEIKEWAANTLATLRNHMEFSKTCKKKLEKINKI